MEELKPTPKAARNYMYTIFIQNQIYQNIHDMPDKNNLKDDYEAHNNHMVAMYEQGHIGFLAHQMEECPKTKRLHLQGYVEFPKMTTLKQAKAILGDTTTHLERRRGSQEDALTYCTKLESRVPFLQPFIIGEKTKQGKRNDLKRAYEMLKEKKKLSEVIEEIPHMIRYTKQLKDVQTMLVEPRDRNEPMYVEVIIGTPGSGKTRSVYDKEPEVYTVPIQQSNSVWFDGYQGQEAVLFDDFYGGIKYSNMLQLLDRYPIQVPIKGGYVNWRPKRIYITSNKDIETWYGSDIPALKRRINQIHYQGSISEVVGNTIPLPKTT